MSAFTRKIAGLTAGIVLTLLATVGARWVAPTESPQVEGLISIGGGGSGGGGGGDITSVAAGVGLSGGGVTGAVSLAVDPTVVQSRVSGTCGGGGSSIRTIAQDGTVTCDATGGDVTSVTAGRGLAGGGTSGALTLTTTVPNNGWRCYTDFFGAPWAATVGDCGVFLGASGGTFTNVGTGLDPTHPSGALLTTTGNAASRAAIVSSGSGTDSVILGAGANVSFEMVLQFSAVSDGTDTYILRVGFLDSINGAPTDGVWFEYVQASDTDWQCKTNNNTTPTVVDSTVVAAAATSTKLRIEVDDSTTARFFINGSQVCGAVTTTIPSGAARATQFGVSFIRTAGTATRTVSMDYLDALGTFTGAGR